MTLRGPAAHLRRPPSWRRSGDESHWESFTPDREVLPPPSGPRRAPRPRSAIEGGQLDYWLEHLQRIQSDLVRNPVQYQVPGFGDRTASVSSLHKEPNEYAWRQPGIPSFSRTSSSCLSTTLDDSLAGSQESLQSWFSSPPQRSGSWEKVNIMQTPRKEQTQLSYLAPVKFGWLPIQRRVIMADVCNQNQIFDHSAGKVKLKQPITPTIQNNQAATGRLEDEKPERSESGLKTRNAPEREPPLTRQVPEKQSFLANHGDKLVGWQALKRGWNSNRVSAFPRGDQANELSMGAGSDPNRTSPLNKTPSAESLKRFPLRTTSDDPCKPSSPQGVSNAEACKGFNTKTSSVQPLRATVPMCRSNSTSQNSNMDSSSSVTTIIPQNKAGISSITISSRKVSRSASLPSEDTFNHFPQSREFPSPTPYQHSIDANSRPVTGQRKATIVKVTEQRTMSSTAASFQRSCTPPVDDGLDNVVRQRKATIIKVTEQRESYRPARAGGVSRYPEYRHSYTDGVYKHSEWSQGIDATPLYLDSTKRPEFALALNKSTSDAEKNGGTLHRSSMSLVVSPPSAVAASAHPKDPPRAAGRRSDRPHRPLSCYGNVFGHTGASEESGTQPQKPARRRSFGLPQQTGGDSVSPDRSFISCPTEVGQPATGRPEPNEERPLVNAERRTSLGLTLIKAPDPHSNQSAEDVLALNAAAIIANIKLQRRLSQKRTPAGSSETDSSPPGLDDENKRKETHPDQPRPPLHPKPEIFSLQEALQRSRPDFISRSQSRVREMERRRRERRERADSGAPQSGVALRRRRTGGARATTLNDNLSKPRDRSAPGRTKRTNAETKRKQEDEKKREACLSNRQRVEIFKKKLLDQILHRS
ncbi:(E2-independent) E3 ubiquitin-conjugating enzyme FATS [Antennarius striatus]|uniref:(E2-independent) E3 ubiquitin-conjugating enzyme FATS n=1 Tax=Antennarius striatus TaxID=241820 RepID=UPI0035B34ACC